MGGTWPTMRRGCCVAIHGAKGMSRHVDAARDDLLRTTPVPFITSVSAPPTAFFPPRGPIPTMPPWQGQPAHQLPNPLSTKQFYHCPATQSIRPLATKPSRQRRNARPEPVTRAKSIYLSCPASIKRLRVSTHRFGASSSTRRTGYSPITARISCK